MSEKKQNIPKIRFSGFTDDWELHKLGDVVETIGTGKSKFVSGTEKSTERPYAVLGSTSVISYDDKYDHSGDFILTARVGANAGSLYKYSGNVKISDNTVFIQAKNLDFVYYLLTKFDIKKLSFGTGQPLIKASELQKLTLLFPVKEIEQIQIGKLFKNLDNLITLHQRKLEKIEMFKKGMLRKMFPEEGEKYPRLRFGGFTDDWEQRKLGDITKSYSGGTPSVGEYDYYDGDIPFIRSAEINSDSTELFISEAGLNNSSAKMVEVGDILYALYGATSGEVGISRINGAINQAILVIQPEEGYDSQFIMQWLRYQKKEIINKYLQGGQGNLSGSIVKYLSIELPSYNEQTQIGKFFSQLDTLITLHQRKLESLNDLKKALLQQMYI